MRNLHAAALVLVAICAGCGGRQIPADAFSDAMADAVDDVSSVDAADVAAADLARADLIPVDSGTDTPGTDLPDGAAEDGAADDVTQDVPADALSDVTDDASGVRCPTIQPATSVGTLDQTPLAEISGLAASRRHPGVLWGHNDSGDDPVIYAIQLPNDPAGEPAPLPAVRFTVNETMAGWPDPVPEWKSTAVDWEDIAIGPFAGFEGDSIFIADMGDNSFADPEKRRQFLRVLILPEPVEITAGDISTVRYFKVEYADEPHDSEAFFVDPWTGDLYVVEKRHDGATAGVYRVAAEAMSGVGDGATLTAARVATINVALATGADMSPDGLMLAIRNYGGAPDGVVNNGLIWTRTADMTVVDMLADSGCPLPNFPAEPWFEVQGESIAIKPDGSGFFTVCERNSFFCPDQNLHFWEFAR